MNIRQRWTEVKKELAIQIRRVHNLIRDESDAKDLRFPNYIISGQKLSMKNIVEALNLPHCENQGEDNFIVRKGNGFYGTVSLCSSEEYWIEHFLSNHCPLSLKEADILVEKLQSITPEYVHHALDKALLDNSY